MKKVSFLFSAIFLVLYFTVQNTFCTFDTIDSVRSYVDTIEEYPDVEMRDWSNPDYTSYYLKKNGHFFSRFFEKIGIYRPIFSSLQAKNTLESITRKRERNGFFGRFVQKIIPSEGDKILIFGDLCGAIHSFVRDLEYLKTINVIANDFTLKEGYYLIINGNAADKSHHITEMLSIIAKLLEKNPKTVFYVRGIPENKEGWVGKTFEYELTARFTSISSERVPLASLIDRFFNTLPIAVFIAMDIGNTIENICFCPEGIQNKELRSEKISIFLQPTIVQHHYKMNETIDFEKKNQKKTNLISLFRAEDRRKTYRENKGIIRLDDEEGIPSFATMSGPVESNRRLYDFFYDAFVELSLGKNLTHSTITLFFRDVREITSFQQETIPFLTKSLDTQETKKEQAIAEATPIIKKNIRLGCTLDLTRALARVGEQHRKGIQTAIKRYEQQDNMDIQITFLDDQYTPDIAQSNIETLLNKNIDIILGPIGAPTTERYLNLIQEKKLIVLFPMTGASILRNPKIPYIINFRASYKTEAQILLHEAINVHHAEKIALFYQDDSFGKAALDGIEKYEKLIKLPDNLIVKIPYERNNVNFTTQADAITKANAQVIILVTVISAARELFRLFDLSFFSGKIILGVSDLSEQTFLNFCKERGITIQTLSVTPSPNSNLEIAKRFREDATAQHIETDTFSFEGYIDATICFDALKKIKEPQGTKESLHEVMTSYKKYNLFDLELTFNPENQDFSQGTWWVSNEKEWRIAKAPLLTPEPLKEQKKEEPPKEKQEKEKLEEGKKTEVVTERKQINIGCSMDLSRGLRIANEQQQEGMKMALARFEKELPVDVKFVFLDDQYTPQIALENARKFLDQGIYIILGASGSATTQSFLDLCKEGKLLVLFPTTGTPVIRNSSYRYLLHFRPCGCTEAKTMLHEAIITHEAKNIVIFYQDDSFGRGALTGIEQYEKEHDIKQVTLTKIPYNRNDVNFTQQAEQIKKINPDTFILLSTAFAAREIIRLIDISFFYERKIFGISDLAEEAFLKFMKEKGLPIMVTNVMPDIHANIEIAKMFLEDSAKNNYSADALAFEGYVITALFCTMLKQIDSSKDLKEEIVRIVESYKRYPFFGLTLTFNPSMRDLSQPVWLFNGTAWKEIPVV